MTSLTRYVSGHLLIGLVLVTAGLTALIWLTQSLRFVDMIVNRGLPGTTFFHLTLLLLPNFLAIILPLAMATVTLFVYSRLIGDRELVVMQGAGMGPTAIARPAFLIAGAVAMLGYALNFYLLPESYRMFRELQWDIRYNYTHILLQEGAFNPVSKNVTVYVRERASDGQLLGILVHDNRKAERPATIMASRGTLVENAAGARVVMFDGSRQELDRKTHKMSVLYFDRYAFDLEPPPSQAAVRYREPRERLVNELFTIERDLTVDPNEYGRFRTEGHKRLISPLTTIGYTWLAVGFLLAGSVTRRGTGKRVALAAVALIAFQATGMGLENMSAKDARFIPLLYANTLLPIAIGQMALIQRPRGAWAAR